MSYSPDTADSHSSIHTTRQFDRILNTLQNEKIYTDGSGKTEFVLREALTPENLKALVEFPFECSFTEDNNSVVLTIGEDKQPAFNKALQSRTQHSRLSGHTHHRYATEPQSTFLSGMDIYASSFVDDATALLLIHTSGILQYRKPDLYAYKPKWPHFYDDVISLYESWLADNNIAMTRGIQQLYPQLPVRIEELPSAEVQHLHRQFALDTNMIVSEASWQENSAQLTDLMAVINLQI